MLCEREMRAQSIFMCEEITAHLDAIIAVVPFGIKSSLKACASVLKGIQQRRAGALATLSEYCHADN